LRTSFLYDFSSNEPRETEELMTKTYRGVASGMQASADRSRTADWSALNKERSRPVAPGSTSAFAQESQHQPQRLFFTRHP
jgi:hypothetical protein